MVALTLALPATAQPPIAHDNPQGNQGNPPLPPAQGGPAEECAAMGGYFTTGYGTAGFGVKPVCATIVDTRTTTLENGNVLTENDGGVIKLANGTFEGGEKIVTGTNYECRDADGNPLPNADCGV